jgi:hypothetical protein
MTADRSFGADVADGLSWFFTIVSAASSILCYQLLV